MASLLKLINCGQSYWLDNLTRKLIQSGEIEKRVKEQGLRGITSNPAIFEKAIVKSHDYDEQILHLSGKGAEEIYEALVIQDIQDACDLLMPVFEESKGLDGYVSLEVSPHLAHDREGTEKETRRLFKWVNRPNCLIKIPGTKEGIAAVEQMLYEGININITLLFSVDVYEQVAKAYIKALKRRADEGKPIDKIASVASFFLSRIDVLVDTLLEQRISGQNKEHDQKVKALLGKAAIANAKLAYQRFLKIFHGEDWDALKKKGARVQRPLWASTSTKNPNYNDVMYVEPLIGEHTVNTLPDQTIEAFADHGKVEKDTILQNVAEAKENIGHLKQYDIDIDFVTAELVNEGIQKFIDPYDTLIKSIEEKAASLKTA